ncbi:hypothetical protein [Paracoccus pacificus]|uniref:Succinate dehydrogenase n=1 Tax=Paracoccus pacificus TaxID=1463598 RepID=A0ABW4R7R9_9RHOB
MNKGIIIAAGAALMTLAGCVQPMGQGVVVGAPGGSTPSVSREAMARDSARAAISAQMASRLPGRNTGPYTECVMKNATTAELVSIAESPAMAASITTGIVSRPETAACIGALARQA